MVYGRWYFENHYGGKSTEGLRERRTALFGERHTGRIIDDIGRQTATYNTHQV